VSEYQYYEFLAIDRPLTDQEMGKLRSISSRAEITSTHFCNEYHFGDLKADPSMLLKRYFDAHVYIANWGTHRFSLRFPANLVDACQLNRYCVGEQICVEEAAKFVFLDVWSESEDDDGWVEGGGWMASLMPLRQEILKGDLRALYLAWLLAVQNEELDPSDTEPPVPAGLGTLSASLQRWAQFLRIDDHLMVAAVEGSALAATEPTGLRQWLAALPTDQKDALLLDVVQDNTSPHIGITLLRRFRSEAGNDASAKSYTGRTVGQIIDRADVLREAYEAKQARATKRKRRRCEKAAAAVRAECLNNLAKRQPEAWATIEKLIHSKKPKAYDEAVILLKDLHDLGIRNNEAEAFASRLDSLRERHERKPSFLARLDRVGLLSGQMR